MKSQIRVVRLMTVAFVFTFGAFLAGGQTTPQPPYALLQNATITATGNTITANHVPVVISNGVTVYVNLALQFNVDSNGNLTLSAGYPQVLPSPALLTSSFVGGNYVGPSTVLSGKALVAVSGPGISDGGATQWTLSTSSGADGCTYPASASWYTGPITSNPLASRISKAGITSTAWSYGTVGILTCNHYNWSANALIGVSQVGNTITIVTFTDAYAADHSTPVEQITYTLAH